MSAFLRLQDLVGNLYHMQKIHENLNVNYESDWSVQEWSGGILDFDRTMPISLMSH